MIKWIRKKLPSKKGGLHVLIMRWSGILVWCWCRLMPLLEKRGDWQPEKGLPVRKRRAACSQEILERLIPPSQSEASLTQKTPNLMPRKMKRNNAVLRHYSTLPKRSALEGKQPSKTRCYNEHYPLDTWIHCQLCKKNLIYVFAYM